MRGWLELVSDPRGTVSGSFAPEDHEPVAFVGWLDLLRVLESDTVASPDDLPGGSGDPRKEAP